MPGSATYQCTGVDATVERERRCRGLTYSMILNLLRVQDLKVGGAMQGGGTGTYMEGGDERGRGPRMLGWKEGEMRMERTAKDGGFDQAGFATIEMYRLLDPD
jgi:hypothetical protein